MKNYYRFLLLAIIGLLTTTVATAQESEHVSIGYSELDGAGVFVKFESVDLTDDLNVSFFLEVTQLMPKLSNTLYFTDGTQHKFDIKGKGHAVELGFRKYFSNKIGSGFYAGTGLKYSTLKFKESIIDLKAKYTYFSPFTPEIGYKLDLGSKLFLEAFVGTEWRLKIKRDDEIGHLFDPWEFKLGAAIGYKF